MKPLNYLTLLFLLLTSSYAFGQTNPSKNSTNLFKKQILTIEPGIGINPYPFSDLLLSNLVQLNLKKHISIVSHTAYSRNDAFNRNFNYIKTNHNCSIMQKIGIGATAYTKKSAHTFSLMAGIKLDAYKETLDNPEFEKVIASRSSIKPDVGLLYNLKMGQKKYFFSYRMYLPLYPYPLKSVDVQTLDGNLANISLEFGIGFRLK